MRLLNGDVSAVVGIVFGGLLGAGALAFTLGQAGSAHADTVEIQTADAVETTECASNVAVISRSGSGVTVLRGGDACNAFVIRVSQEDAVREIHEEIKLHIGEPFIGSFPEVIRERSEGAERLRDRLEEIEIDAGVTIETTEGFRVEIEELRARVERARERAERENR